MNTCEVCDAPLRGTASTDPVSHGVANYHVCSYTYETVLHDRFAPNVGREPRP